MFYISLIIHIETFKPKSKVWVLWIIWKGKSCKTKRTSVLMSYVNYLYNVSFYPHMLAHKNNTEC